MTKIPRLTKKSEERISASLSKVAALTNAGESPNDAIVKVASDQRISAGHVRLMVRAFNNGCSLGHIRNHENLTEKAASFPLADAGEILERMFPSEVKTPAEQKAASIIGDDYSMSPVGWLQRRARATRRTALTKAAADCGSEESKAPPYPEDPRRMGKKALSQLHDLRREHERAKDAAIGACYKVAAAVNDVGEYFRRPDALDITEVRVNTQAVLGDPGGRLVAHAAAFTKKATVRSDHWLFNEHRADRFTHPVDWEAEPYLLIKTALDAMGDFTEKRKTLDKFEEELVEKRAEILSPFGLSPETDVIVGSVWDNQSQTKQAAGLLGLGLAGFMGGSARGLAAKLSPASHEDLVQEKLQELASPEHEDKLRAIRTQTMIHEMMTGDPVISGYDPEEVMEAYNHLAEVAPRAMQQRVMAQGLIRRYLEQASAIDPFDVGQMLDVEKSLIDRDMPQQLMANQSPGVSRELGPPQSKPRGTSETVQPTPNIIDEVFKS